MQHIVSLLTRMPNDCNLFHTTVLCILDTYDPHFALQLSLDCVCESKQRAGSFADLGLKLNSCYLIQLLHEKLHENNLFFEFPNYISFCYSI